MSCTYRDKLLESRDKTATQIQEAIDCKNPAFLDQLFKQAASIQALLEKVVDVDGDDNQDFDITSVGV